MKKDEIDCLLNSEINGHYYEDELKRRLLNVKLEESKKKEEKLMKIFYEKVKKKNNFCKYVCIIYVKL